MLGELFIAIGKFQSTPPREGRLAADMLAASYAKFQSTPPREGRRLVDREPALEQVSIHAPA